MNTPSILERTLIELITTKEQFEAFTIIKIVLVSDLVTLVCCQTRGVVLVPIRSPSRVL